VEVYDRHLGGVPSSTTAHWTFGDRKLSGTNCRCRFAGWIISTLAGEHQQLHRLDPIEAVIGVGRQMPPAPKHIGFVGAKTYADREHTSHAGQRNRGVAPGDMIACGMPRQRRRAAERRQRAAD